MKIAYHIYMDLSSLFYPKSIAVVGASAQEGSVGFGVFKNLMSTGYQGKVYPVNIKKETILGVEAFPSVKEVADKIDLAVVIVPALVTPLVMKELAEKKVPAAVIISAGFKEVGDLGLKLEEEVKKICQENKITLLGPNCLGLINPEIKMNASFAGIMPKEGNIAFVSQSGALCTSILDYAQELEIGFSKFVSIGNKACLDETSIMEYLAEDQKTKAIFLYLEQLTNGKRFIEVAKKITRGPKAKPIIAIKAGRTKAGATASASHTGALTSDDALYEAIFNQGGILRANSIEELFDLGVTFANNPKAQGNRIAIVTNAGGPGVLATDEAIDHGLEMAQLSSSTVQTIKEVLPSVAKVGNPVDVWGDAKADRYQVALNAVLSDENVDGMLVILTPQTMTEIKKTAAVIIEAKRKTKKPIVASFIGAAAVKEGVNDLRGGGVAHVNCPDAGAKALASLVNFSKISSRVDGEKFLLSGIDKDKVATIIGKAQEKNQTDFPEVEAREIIEAYKIPLPKSKWAHSREEAIKEAQLISQNLVLKVVSPDILHETEVGGVMLDVKANEVGAKYDEMMTRVAAKAPQARLEGALIMEMVPTHEGIEVVLGAKRDVNLGTAIMFGLGGIYVEFLKDVVFRFTPLTKGEAYEMIKSIRSAKIFEGVRKMPPLDVEAVVDCLGRVGQLMEDFPQIKELDINPVIVLPKGRGVKALDVRIVIG